MSAISLPEQANETKSSTACSVHITENWRSRPLESRAVAVNLIANTRTEKGLKIKSEIDDAFYQKGIKIADEDMAKLAIIRDEFHDEWNYKFTRITIKSVQLIFSSSLTGSHHLQPGPRIQE